MDMEKPLTKNIPSNGGEPPDRKAYEKSGGYAGLRKALRMPPAEIHDLVDKSNLRGRGGAGFPTGKKWSFVPMGKDAPHPKYLVANADEMEPGTFKDRLLMEGNPHQMIEGMIIAAYAIQADISYIFLRQEYKLSERRLRKALAEAYENHYLGKNILGSTYSLEMHLHVSAGRYMCGEETGLLNALEGKRANPRSKPPFPPQVKVYLAWMRNCSLQVKIRELPGKAKTIQGRNESLCLRVRLCCRLHDSCCCRAIQPPDHSPFSPANAGGRIALGVRRAGENVV